jgi:hypothetical protein
MPTGIETGIRKSTGIGTAISIRTGTLRTRETEITTETRIETEIIAGKNNGSAHRLGKVRRVTPDHLPIAPEPNFIYEKSESLRHALLINASKNGPFDSLIMA